MDIDTGHGPFLWRSLQCPIFLPFRVLNFVLTSNVWWPIMPRLTPNQSMFRRHVFTLRCKRRSGLSRLIDVTESTSLHWRMRVSWLCLLYSRTSHHYFWKKSKQFLFVSLCFRHQAPLDEFFTLVTLSSLAIGLTAMLSSLRCFGSNRATFWR